MLDECAAYATAAKKHFLGASTDQNEYPGWCGRRRDLTLGRASLGASLTTCCVSRRLPLAALSRSLSRCAPCRGAPARCGRTRSSSSSTRTSARATAATTRGEASACARRSRRMRRRRRSERLPVRGCLLPGGFRAGYYTNGLPPHEIRNQASRLVCESGINYLGVPSYPTWAGGVPRLAREPRGAPNLTWTSLVPMRTRSDVVGTVERA